MKTAMFTEYFRHKQYNAERKEGKIPFKKLYSVVVLLLVVAGPYSQTNCQSGRHAMTHLFCWKWSDVARECEEFLGPNGYCAVQISPANEHRVITWPHDRPWGERYHPVSYQLTTRSGNEADFRDMVGRCNRVGVRIYVDVILNHMATYGGPDRGTGGTAYNPDTLDFPGVPYSNLDFNGHDNCPTQNLDIQDFGNVQQNRNCRLLGLNDLRVQKEYVRGKLAEFLNRLIDIGVAGFRLDSAKHMWPGDIAAIFSRLHNLNTNYFPHNSRPFGLQEVRDYGNDVISVYEYRGTGRSTMFAYSQLISNAIHGHWPFKNLMGMDESWTGLASTYDAVVFVDNHDIQREHGGPSVITFKDPRNYKVATAFMLAHPYGYPRVMSSFHFEHFDQGAPHNSDKSIKDVRISNGVCTDGWVCEHRWRQISNMVQFKNIVTGVDIANKWDNGNRQIAFSRGNRGFIAINLEGHDLDQNLQTGLPGGTYCDVISGNYEGGRCSGRSITVGGDGRAQIHVSNSWEDPMIALHIGSKVGSPKRTTGN